VTGRASDEIADGPEPSGTAASRPGFAHASEAEFARILDFYQVAWQYEPYVFPILWSLDGDVLESFAPDFYLPELDLYIEMTTLRQKLVRKKNRKLRRLRELYPDVRIKLFYARDFRALMLKYGKVALADALSGSEGQFTPANPGPAAEQRAASAGQAETAGPLPAGATASPLPAGTGSAPQPERTGSAPQPAGTRATPPPARPTLTPSPTAKASPNLAPMPKPSARPARRRARPAARIGRTSGRPGGIIGGDTPAGPAGSTRDEGASR
jgi:hypoxanthine phosphoribosyltransferase